MTERDDALPDALERQRRDERRRALRTLLATPLVGVDHPDFPRIRRHGAWLRDWLARETGWPLQVEGDFARLHKRPADLDDATRPARSGRGQTMVTFNRRRYALLCLLLADLERSDAQVTLGRLAESLVNAAADPALADAGLRFALDNRGERRDLVAVVRLLLDWRVLIRVAGDEEAFVQRGVEGDVLYDIDRRILAALLVTTRGPSLVEFEAPVTEPATRLATITETFVPDTAEGRNRAQRHALTRRLLDDPVVYFDDLDPDAAAYLTSQRTALVGRVEEASGLVAEIRAEGIAMVDPDGELSDALIPAEGTEGHATLLLAEHLAATGPAGTDVEALEARVRDWQQRYGRYWRKNAREPGAERELCARGLDRLAALRLIERRDDRVRPLPALARFDVRDPSLIGQQMDTPA